ncbi:hypothetical protein CLM62_21765 [Streptomyces sp. SA15]|uniref:hypothetical protein n=1 Tax=Streptomyces sp. SA15 TaxID=934019 RepID=UPI000BB09E92|nr:hypothetical protein [Streptomyces sp. SA15]PAZ14075.1 hypothetical protein CLM62_21765 [Streptomyces sp. SA15]
MTAPSPSGQSQYSAHSEGSNALSVGQVVGNLVLKFFTGVGNVEKWSVWNWVPCGFVLVLCAVSVLLMPEGPWDQFVVAAVCLVLPLGATFWRAIWGRDRAIWRRALVSWGSVALAVIGLAQMVYLRAHGEVDVTGSTRIEPQSPAGDGATLRLTVDSETVRRHLRLTLGVEEGSVGTQSCAPDTTFDVALAGQQPEDANRSLTSGTAVDIALGGQSTDVRVVVTVHTLPGCLMDISVDSAVLHD